MNKSVQYLIIPLTKWCGDYNQINLNETNCSEWLSRNGNAKTAGNLKDIPTDIQRTDGLTDGRTNGQTARTDLLADWLWACFLWRKLSWSYSFVVSTAWTCTCEFNGPTNEWAKCVSSGSRRMKVASDRRLLGIWSSVSTKTHRYALKRRSRVHTTEKIFSYAYYVVIKPIKSR